MHSRHRNILVWSIIVVTAVTLFDALFPYLVLGGIVWFIMSQTTKPRRR